MIAYAERILLSRPFWALRLLTAALSIILIWSGIIMTSDLILYTPADYLPYLVLIGLVVTTLFTMVRAKTAYNDTVKAQLRAGIIKEAPGFGLDYMSAYIGTIVLGVVGAFLIPGIVYEAIMAEPDFAGCIVIAFVWAVLVGIQGATKASEIVDLFRDASKIQALEADAKKPKE